MRTVFRKPPPLSNFWMSRSTSSSRSAGASMRTAPAATISRSIVPGSETLTARPRWTSATCAAVKRKCVRRSVSMDDTPRIAATCGGNDDGR